MSLVAHWTADTVSGTTWPDSSGNGHDATIHQPSEVKWTIDPVSEMYQVESTQRFTSGPFISAPDSAAWELTDATVMALVRIRSITTQYPVFFSQSAGGAFNIFYYNLAIGKTALALSGGGGTLLSGAAWTPTLGQIYELSATFTNSTLTAQHRRDGAADGAAVVSGVALTTGMAGAMLLGASAVDFNQLAQCIDLFALRIYNSVESTGTIDAAFDADRATLAVTLGGGGGGGSAPFSRIRLGL